MLVIKFGGTSLAGRQELAQAAKLVRAIPQAAVVVVSAMGDTTDRLLRAGRLAEAGQGAAAQQIIDELHTAHTAALPDAGLADTVQTLFDELRSLLEGVRLVREQSARTAALIASFGERLSAPLMAGTLEAAGCSAKAVDSRSLVRTDDCFDNASVDLETTRTLVRASILPLLEGGVTPVVTGFLGSTRDGVTTTLGRGGSDYSATLLAQVLEAEEVWICTDVDGVLTADPRLVKEARSLENITYREAAEMSYFGARVLHARTMRPAMEAGIPVRVRSTFEPERPGTLITETAPTLPRGVKTVSSMHGQALVTVDGRGMAGVPGVARRIFEASELSRVNVVMISQASSEQTVSLVVPGPDADRLVAALHERFAPELARGAVERFDVQRDIAVISIVGQGMAGTVGISGDLFTALGGAQVNVLAIAQGASELSISVAVNEHNAARAVRAVHTRFGLTKLLNLVLIGCGRVGRALLGQLDQTRARVATDLGLELRLLGVATSSKLLLDPDGIAPDAALDRLAHAGDRLSDAALIAAVARERFADVVLVDVSAAPTGPLHQLALDAGFHVVTANKIPLAGPLETYKCLFASQRAHGVRYQYETTFGAGLPVLHTLKELLNTGDAIESVSGCLSGTLGYVCSRLQDGPALADIVAEAAAKGFTEPDPREDLSGRDVARKALIIARACGMALEPEDVHLEPLVPQLEHGLDAAIEAYEPELQARLVQAQERGAALRYVASISHESVRVGLQEVPADGPIGSLQGPGNILVFSTRRYHDLPIVIRGPGAGAEVTAAGVLGDVLRILGPHGG